MSKSTLDWEVWLYIILYFAFLGGLLYLIKFITLLPYILLVIATFLSYLVYKQKLTAVNAKDGSSVLYMLWLVILVAAIAFIAKPQKYDKYIGKYIVRGKMVTKVVTVEADEGSNTWEEMRTYWEPNTKTGETIMNMISWFNLTLVAISIILCIRFYVRTKEREDKLKKKSRYSTDYD